jgi:hypothetical protein
MKTVKGSKSYDSLRRKYFGCVKERGQAALPDPELIRVDSPDLTAKWLST